MANVIPYLFGGNNPSTSSRHGAHHCSWQWMFRFIHHPFLHRNYNSQRCVSAVAVTSSERLLKTRTCPRLIAGRSLAFHVARVEGTRGAVATQSFQDAVRSVGGSLFPNRGGGRCRVGRRIAGPMRLCLFRRKRTNRQPAFNKCTQFDIGAHTDLLNDTQS